MDTFIWLLPIPLIWLAIKLTQIVSVVRMLRGLRFNADQIAPFPADDIPAWFHEAAKPLAESLLAAGFTRAEPRLQRSAAGAEFDSLVLAFTHPEEPLRAEIRLNNLINAHEPCLVTFDTTLADGTELVTVTFAEPSVGPLAPDVALETCPGADIPTLLARHRTRVDEAASAGRGALVLDDSAKLRRAQNLADTAETALRATGDVETRPDGALILRWGPAFRIGSKLIQSTIAANKAAAKAAKADRALNPSANQPAPPASPTTVSVPPPLPTPTHPVPLSDRARDELEWLHYRRLLALKKIRLAWLPKTLLMIGSLVLFTLAIGWQMSPGLGLVLILALAFHEGGHLLGMRLFGHRDTQLLFLPFFGGVAVAHDRLVLAPWKQLVMLFLGPLPGIFIGLGILLGFAGTPDATFAFEAGILLLVFNGFNLLPILPLDGGQIADVALFARFPRLRTVFLAASSLGLAAVGYMFSSTVMIVLGVFSLLRLQVEWRHAGIVKTLRTELPPATPEETVIKRLLSRLRSLPPVQPLQQRLQIAASLDERIRRPGAGWMTLALAVAGYASVVVVGLILAFLLVVREGRETVSAARARATAAGLTEWVAEPSAPAIPDEDNAALPLLEASKLWNPGDRSADFTTPKDADATHTLALFAAAAARPSFALPADSTPNPQRNRLDVAFATLTQSIATELRYERHSNALTLALSGLKALRHLEAAPGWWNRTAHRWICRQLWTDVEASLAGDFVATEEQLLLLADLANEARARRFARRSIIAERILRGRQRTDHDSYTEDGTPVGMNTILVRAFAWLDQLNPESYRTQAAEYDMTIALDAVLASAESPDAIDPLTNQMPNDSETPDEFGSAGTPGSELGWTLGAVADDLAALRVVRAGLAACWMRLHGTPPPDSPADLRAPWLTGSTEHPGTHAPLGLETRGAFSVLFLPRDPAQADRYPDPSNPDRPEYAWRIPRAPVLTPLLTTPAPL